MLMEKKRQKIAYLDKKIRICRQYKQELLTNASKINAKLWNSEITPEQHKRLLEGYLQGKTVKEWLREYDGIIGNHSNQIKRLRGHSSQRKAVLFLIFLSLILFLLLLEFYTSENSSVVGFVIRVFGK